VLTRLNEITLQWWFGHLLLLGLALAALALAALMEPTPDVVSLFGWDVPVMCSWRRMFGFGCPGCGLTRSFSFMAHGQVIPAFRVNLLGPLIFAVVAVQIPLRAFRLWQGPGRGARSAKTPS